MYRDWGAPNQEPIRRATPGELEALGFAAGSMAPKVKAACDFVRATGKVARVGALDDLPALLAGSSGTEVAQQ